MGKSKNGKKRKKKTHVTKKSTKKKVTSKKGRKKGSVKKKNSAIKNKQNSNVQKEKVSIEKNPAEKQKERSKEVKEILKEEKVQTQVKKSLFDKEKIIIFKKTIESLVSNLKKKESSVKKSKIKKRKIPKKIIRRLILCSIFCLILALILMYPFGITNYKSEASGKILDVPKLSVLSEECCMYNATFKSIRSYSSLKIEFEHVLENYKKVNCEGKDYFYNEKEDFTITDYGFKKGLIFSEYYITYSKGNVCEVDPTLKNIELLPDQYSLEDAKHDGCYVISNGEEFNVSSYNQFLKDIEENKESTLRIVTTNLNGNVIITDLKYMNDGKFKVIYDGTRDQENAVDNRVMLAYFYDHIGIYKDKFYAYNGSAITSGMLETSDVYYLFDMIE